MTDCARLQENYEAYALGVLEGEERAALEAHLERNCATCAAGVERARSLVAQLAFAAPEAIPPADLKARLMAAVAAESREVTPERARAMRAFPRPEGSSWKFSSLFPALGWAAAAAMVVFSVWTANQNAGVRQQLAQRDDEIRIQRVTLGKLKAETVRYQQLLTILSAPGTLEVSMKSAQASQPLIRAHWNEKLGLVLTTQQMPAPGQDRVFQLWVVPKKGNPISAGVFQPDASGQVIHIASVDVKLSEAGALAITEEPGKGSPQPTMMPIWVGALGK